MSHSSKRVRQFLAGSCLDVQVVTLDDSTRTSQIAADVLGCSVSQIAKSIVFVDGGAVVVVISGDKRVDSKEISRLLGEKVRIAHADEVRKYTGYVIGGVPPFPHVGGVRVLLDSSLSRFEEVWASAGAPNSMMKISVDAIMELVGRDFVDVAK
ncbi:MAG: YbaK/EbsC family protein [Candidatus Bathyarchaeia archaeon]